MKYDPARTMTLGAKRTYTAFRTAMFTLLREKEFEIISAKEICETAGYPRATFYNYFADKYDLLNYCWNWLADQIHLEDHPLLPHEKALYIFSDRIFDFTKENFETIVKVLSHNSETGYMFSSFRNFMNEEMRRIFKACSYGDSDVIPQEIVADHYSNTLLLVWQWCCIKEKTCSKEQAHSYLKYLISR